MLSKSVFALLATLPVWTWAYSRGPPCTVSDSMTPSPTYHGAPQDPTSNPPPYRVALLTTEGFGAKTYDGGETFTVRVSGSTYFRGVMVQARVLDAQGSISDKRAGEFQEESSWKRVGLGYHDCEGVNQAGVIHTDSRRKYYLNLKWVAPTTNVGTVQFVVTLVHNQTYFWARWAPEQGRLEPGSFGARNFIQVNDLDKNNVDKTAEGSLIISAEIPTFQPAPFEPFGPVIRPGPIRPVPQTTQSRIETGPQTTSRFIPDTTPKTTTTTTNPTTTTSTSRRTTTTTTTTTQAPATEPFPFEESVTETPETTEELFTRPVVFTEQDLTEADLTTVAATESQFVTEPLETFTEPFAEEGIPPEIEDFTDPPFQTQRPRPLRPLVDLPTTTTPPALDYPAGENGPRVFPPVKTKEIVAVAPFAYVEIIPYDLYFQEQTGFTGDSTAPHIDPRLFGSDFCSSGPCKNGGSCENEREGYYCICPAGFTGYSCEKTDHCASNPCSERGVCQIKEFGYECICDPGYAGEKCDLVCPGYICKNGGTCYLDLSSREYRCHCPPGYEGRSCQRETDNCKESPCKNGGTCSNKPESYSCACQEGWHGKDCQRPCVNIYRSCASQWNDEDRCETMKYQTRFFDVNCPVTCGSCEALNKTAAPEHPLPPKLEPFDFLIGKWEAKSDEEKQMPVPFNGGYESTIEFQVTEAPMFGSPAINVTKVATNVWNTSTHITQGFMMLSRTSPITVSLSSVSNNGQTFIEEGKLNTTLQEMTLKTIFNASADLDFPPEMSRVFKLSGAYLSELIRYTTADGAKKVYQLYYTKPKIVTEFSALS